METISNRMAPRSSTYRHPLKVFPYTWASVGHFLIAYVAMAALWTLAGLAVTNWLQPSALGEREIDLNEWFAQQRTESRTTVAHWGSVPSDTVVILGLMVAVLIAVPILWRRWHGWAFLVGALALQAAVYQTSNTIVGRPRPPVEQLEQVINNAFPSGHTGAGVTFYLGLLIIASWHTVSRSRLAVLGVVALLVPLIIAISRLYLGVHYLTDILAGALLGITSVSVALAIARRGLADTVAQSDGIEPPHTTSLDLTDDRDHDSDRSRDPQT